MLALSFSTLFVMCLMKRLGMSALGHSETLESSAINDGWSMLAMFITVLYEVEGKETETLKQYSMQS